MKHYILLFIIATIVVLAWCTTKTNLNTNPIATLSPADEMNIHMCLMWWGQNCDTILDPANADTYADMIRSQCDLMPMPVCTEYFADGSYDGAVIHDHGNITSEEQFIAEMIPHHQEAVDSSLALITKTQNPQLQQLLSGIISAQRSEITMMSWWLDMWYADSDYVPTYQLMMRDTSTISAISTLETMYLQDMIAHHQWAVQMAQAVLKLPDIRPEVAQFAQQVIDVQQDEIQQMQDLLLQE